MKIHINRTITLPLPQDEKRMLESQRRLARLEREKEETQQLLQQQRNQQPRGRQTPSRSQGASSKHERISLSEAEVLNPELAAQLK